MCPTAALTIMSSLGTAPAAGPTLGQPTSRPTGPRPPEATPAFILNKPTIHDEAEINILVNDGVYDWAEDGNTETIPTGKLAAGGTDDQVLTRTSTGMDWEDATGGGGGTGTTVVANPGGTGLTDLDTVTIGSTDYAIPGASGGEANVQADWTETDTSNDAYIENKPDISGGAATQILAKNSATDFRF